jgi:predicted transcriptional regulator of viral defense system
MKELTEIESKIYQIFRGHKAFARKEAFERSGVSPAQQAHFLNILAEKGYLSANKLGHYKETAQAQKARLGGLTASQYVEQGRAEMRRQDSEAFLSMFRK